MASNSAEGIRWDLSDLFSSHDDARVKSVLDDCRKRAEGFSADFRDTISKPGGPAPERLLRALQELEEIEERLSRVSTYSGLLYAADSLKPEYQDLEQKVEQQSRPPRAATPSAASSRRSPPR
jgi:oligoendopeptidase F